ncbi:MAG: LysR substrate-binding domain-containing protein [Siculibacillus sp.]
MYRRGFLPPTGALVAFECAARHESFSRAAEELHLTQGAISRQIRALEEIVGVELFERVRQRVVLSEAGRAYLGDVRRSLGDLGEATHRVMGFAGTRGVLDLAVLPTFGARWLVPRLPRFLAAHPDVTIHMSARIEPFDLASSPFDAAIHVGQPVWAGGVLEHLMDEEVVPVGDPGLVARAGIERPRDLERVALLHQSTRPSAWADWFASVGVTTDAAWRGARFDQFSMVAEAAASGMGAALVPRFLIEEELARGRLAILFAEPLRTQSAYYVVHPASKGRSALLRAFEEWIVAEAGSGGAGGVR